MAMYELIPFTSEWKNMVFLSSFSLSSWSWLVLPGSFVCASLYPVSCVSKEIPS